MVWEHGFVVAHGIVPWYCMWLSLYKAWGGSIVNRTGCGYCIVLEETLWEREEEVQRFCCRVYPFIFLDWNKRTGKFVCGRSPSFGWTTLYLCLSVMFNVFLHLVYWFNCIIVIALWSYFSNIFKSYLSSCHLHFWIWIITRFGSSSLDIITGSGSSLDLDHHH